MIRQLTYISTATRGIDFADCAAILEASRRNNGDASVTGLLLFNGLRFLQALEGETAAIEATIARIRADDRHRSIVILSQREVAAREFGQWSMAFERGGSASPADTMIDTVDAMVADVSSANTRALFSSFVRLERSAAA